MSKRWQTVKGLPVSFKFILFEQVTNCDRLKLPPILLFSFKPNSFFVMLLKVFFQMSFN